MADGQSPTTASTETSQPNRMIRSRFVRPKPNLMGAARLSGTTPQTPPSATKGVATTPSATTSKEPEVSIPNSTIENPPLPPPPLPLRLSIGNPPPVIRSVGAATEPKFIEPQNPITKSASLLVSNIREVGSEDGTNTVVSSEVPQTDVDSVAADDCTSQATAVEASPTTATKPHQTTRTTTARLQVSSKKRPRKKQAKPEKDKMTMQDLIYWNPGGSPMKYDSEDTRVPLSNVETNSSSGLDPKISNSAVAEESVDDPVVEGDEVDSIAPQLKIGPDGNIILDEKSLVIETSASKKNLSNSPIVHENLVSSKTYASFRKYKPTAKWTDKQTSKFYLALSAVGTDFSMMSDLFPKRTRHELKLKYKREERLNRALVDKAIGESQQFDFSLFNEDDDDEEEENELTAAVKKSKQKCKSRKTKKETSKRKRNRKSRDLNDPDDDSEMELDDSVIIDDDLYTVSDTEAADPLPNDEVCEEDDDNEIIDGLLKKTRSGRQPKKNSVYNVTESEKKKRPCLRKRSPVSSSFPPPPPPPLASSDDVAANLKETPTIVDEDVTASPSHLLFVAEKPSESGSQVVHVLVYSPRSSATSSTEDLEAKVYTEMVAVQPVVVDGVT